MATKNDRPQNQMTPKIAIPKNQMTLKNPTKKHDKSDMNSYQSGLSANLCIYINKKLSLAHTAQTLIERL